MSQNFIVIHMESISSILFYQHRNEMPVLWNLMKESAAFSRFYSASTSTFMGLSDFMQGDSSELDHHMLYPTEAGCLLGRSSNLFLELLERGYDAHCMRYGTFRDYASADVDNYLGLPSGSGIVTEWHDDYSAYCNGISAFLQQRSSGGKPFALHLLNLVSHVRDKTPEKNQREGLSAVFTESYRLLDKSVEILLNGLRQCNLLSNTMIVAFGDHGNELWVHGLGRGFMHSIAPYASQCSVPLFMYSSRITPTMTDVLTSMVDLKPTILHTLFPEESPIKRESPFAGINIVQEGRRFAFSQNLLALQLEQQDPSRGLIKSYAVTDGVYRVVATSGGNVWRNGGLEMYCDSMDPDNVTNLLQFMELDKEGAVRAFKTFGARHPHFWANMDEQNLNDLARRYAELRQVLHSFIREKEKWALPHLIDNSYNLFPERMFKRMRHPQGWTF